MTTSRQDTKALRALRDLTNRRQAIKVRDVRNSAVLTLHGGGRRVFVTATDAGLYAVAYGSGGGLYLARLIDDTDLVRLASAADRIDVEHDADRLPEAVRYPSVEDSDE